MPKKLVELIENDDILIKKWIEKLYPFSTGKLLKEFSDYEINKTNKIIELKKNQYKIIDE